MKMVIFSILIVIMMPSINIEASDINQQLYDAAYELNVDKVKTLLSTGADPNWLKEGKRSVLEWASYKVIDGQQAQNKLTEIAILLFENGAKLRPHDKDILFFPIAYGAYELTQLFITKGASPTEFVHSNITPVELAAQHGYAEIQKMLVENGAVELDTEVVIQLQFIYEASRDSVLKMEELRKKGAMVNAKNRQGVTALIECLSFPMFSDSAPAFFYLLDIGADVNLQGQYEHTDTSPLHVATENTSYSFTIKNAKPEVIEVIKINQKILDNLIKAGAYVSARNERGQTPLHIAAEYNNIYAAKLFLKHNAKVMPRDGEGKTPLDYAVSEDMINLLKENGAKEL